MTSPAPGTAEQESMADVVERMFDAFGPRLTMPTIVAVVQQCRRELDIVSGPALPEMLERLAFQRLADRDDGVGP